MKYFAAALLAIMGFVTLVSSTVPAPATALFGWTWLTAGLLTFVPDVWRLPQSRLTRSVMRVIAGAWLLIASVVGLFGIAFAVQGVIEVTRHEAIGAAVLLIAAVLHVIVAHALAEPALHAEAAADAQRARVRVSNSYDPLRAGRS